jgi:hypothetical protein
MQGRKIGKGGIGLNKYLKWLGLQSGKEAKQKNRKQIKSASQNHFFHKKDA